MKVRSTLFDSQAMQSTTNQFETEPTMQAPKHGLAVTIITGFLGIG
jgi:hypothetical protein